MDPEATTSGGDGKKRSQTRQYLACAIVNILSFMVGSSFGWIVPMLPVLQSEDSPFGIPPISDTEMAWLASITSVARLLSIPMYGFALQRLGHKPTCLLIAILFLASWTMIFFAVSSGMLFWGRLISGVGFGGVLLVVPSYTIDIAEDNIKGRLGALFILSMNLGCTFAFIMGFYSSFTVFHLTNIFIPIVSMVAFFWLPESPLFLAVQEKTGEAKKALRWLRNGEVNDAEIERLQMRAQEVLEKRKQKVSVRILTEQCTWRALLIGIGLTINQQASGVQPITTYTLAIFKESGTTISPSIATILLGTLPIAGSFLSSLTTEKFGRRVLLIFSNMVMIVCLTLLGVHVYLRGMGRDLQVIGWLPFVYLITFTIGIGLGVLPLPFTIMTEMVSPQARNMVQGICMAVGSMSSFAVTFAFVPTAKLVGQHGCFLLYALVCIVSTVCIFLTVPETKNRSIEDVVKQLKRDDYVRSVLRGNVTAPEDVKLQSPE